MEKPICLLLCSVVILSLAGCKDAPLSEPAVEASPAPEAAVEAFPAPEPAVEAEIPTESTGGIDIDLTSFSSTMVYSEVYNMMVSPESYIGKTVKMEGAFASYHDEASDAYYFACIIADATACCSQGMEFVLTDDYTYPDDYPEEGGDICVVGVFDTYQEGDQTYCTLRNAKII